MMRLLLLLCVVGTVLSQDFYREDATLFRDQVPSRPPRQKPIVDNPLDYEVYFDPSLPPSDSAPYVAGNIRPQRPKFVPKPFQPREPKPVKKLQPNGPILYSAPLDNYGGHLSRSHQDLSNVPGYPGEDYPVFSYVPPTSFSCGSVPVRPGLYADPETGCQAYHVCGEDGRHGYTGASFLCTNGTVFNQYLLTCDWWYNVDCSQAIKQYDVNLDPYKNPLLRLTEDGEAGRAAGPPSPPRDPAYRSPAGFPQSGEFGGLSPF